MASPFRIFRKNQKLWMAGLVVMSMIAFVFLGNAGMMGHGGGGAEEAIVTTTKFGKLGRTQLQVLLENRRIFLDFLASLGSVLETNKVPTSNIPMRVAQVVGPANEDAVEDKWLFAREAEAMGVSVDDKTISTFLGDLTNQSLVRQDFLNILNKLRHGVSEAAFLSIAREELLALRYRQLYHQIGLSGERMWIGGSAAPDERWAFFKRLNEQATVQVAIFRPEDFVEQVKTPSAGTLKDFFEAHKKEYASPYSPDPGFHLPREVNIQYLQADAAKYRSAVTEAEITARFDKDPHKYDRKLEEFEKEVKTEKDEQAQAEKEAAAAREAARSAAEKKINEKKNGEKGEKNEKKSGESKPEPKTPTSKPAETKKNAEPEKKPAESKPDTTRSPSNPPAESKQVPAAVSPKAADSTKLPSAAKPSGSSWQAPKSPFRLVAFADDKPAEKAAAPDSEKKPAAAPASSAAVPKPASENKPVENKKPVVDKKPDTVKEPNGEMKGEKKPEADKKPAEAAKPAARSAAAEAARLVGEEKTPPLPPIKTARERLRDYIRDEVADENLQKDVDLVMERLDKYRQEYTSFDLSKTGSQKPTPPDFAALAGKYMTAHKTGLLPEYALADLDIGKADSRLQHTYVYQYLFGPTTLYKPDVADYRGSFSQKIVFVYWKTDDQPDHIPKWTDAGIQDEVLRVWKLDQARKLAQRRGGAEGPVRSQSGDVIEQIVVRQEGFQGHRTAVVLVSR